MSFIRTVDPSEAEGTLKTIYDAVKKQMGSVPNIMRIQSLRPDLLEATSLLYQRLMLEKQGLSRVTKELLAAYVSKINVCEYWLDAHSAMVMAQGYSREQVESILEDVESSDLIDEPTRALLRFSEKVTREAHRIKAEDIQALRDLGLPDEEILEATFVITWFNMFDRLADALGVPVENLREAVARRQKASQEKG